MKHSEDNTMTEYRTTDMNLAASLRMHGYEMTDIKLNGNKGTFNFINVNDEFINDFDLGKTLVEPVAFNNTIKQLTTSVRRMVQKT